MIHGAVHGVHGVLGVVPVVRDDPAAPGGCAALRELQGVTLLRRAIDRLVGSGRVDRVSVVFGPVSFGAEDGAPAVVVVHDPLHALAPAALVRDVVDALVADPEVDGVLPVRPVTDTLKRVGPDGDVTATADRDAYRVAGSPQAYRTAALARLALAPSAGPRTQGTVPLGIAALPGAVRAAGGRLRTVPAPGEAFAVGTAADVLLAEAVLAGPEVTPAG